MARIWVVLSETGVEVIEQERMYVTSLSSAHLINHPARPILQNRGKDAGLFPLYIQCRSHDDVEEVRMIQKPLLRLWSTFPGGKQLASAIHQRTSILLI